MKTWSSRLESSCYIVFNASEDRSQWHGQETLPEVPHTELTSVTVSVSDDEVHLLILRDFVRTLVLKTRLSNMGFCPPAAHENIGIVQSSSDKSIWLLHI